MHRRNVAISLAIALVGSSVSAAKNDEAASLVDAVIACDPITDTANRLACFDRTVAALKQARSSKGGKAFADKSLRAPDFKPIDSVVTNVVELGVGRWLIVLADHSVWRSLEQTRGLPAKGDKVRIRKGMIGSFAADVGAILGVKLRPMQ